MRRPISPRKRELMVQILDADPKNVFRAVRFSLDSVQPGNKMGWRIMREFINEAEKANAVEAEGGAARWIRHQWNFPLSTPHYSINFWRKHLPEDIIRTAFELGHIEEAMLCKRLLYREPR